MIFGRGGRKEQVGVGELDAYAARCFEDKIRSFSDRCKSGKDGIDNALHMFEDACRSFERYARKPEIDREYYYSRVDPTLIETQKASYVKALIGILSARLKTERGNSYETYGDVAREAKEIREKILRTNNTFKGVFMAYSKGLGDFKNALAELDRSISKLDYELEREKESYSEYRRLFESSAELSRLIALLEDADAEKRLLEGANLHGAEHNPNASVEDTVKKLDSELKSVSEKIGRLDSKISGVFLPLERPARKYDHIIGRKGRLGDAVSDPTNAIRGADDFARLKTELLSMADAIKKGEIELKNSSGVLEEIGRASDPELLREIEMIWKLREEAEEIKIGLRRAEAELERENAKRMEAAAKNERIAALSNEMDSLSKEIEVLKESIENSYEKYYKKRISIRLS